MSNTFSGKIIAILPEKQVTEKFRVAQIVVEQESGQYPKKGLFDFVNDKCDVLLGLSLEESITVYFEPDARQGNDGRWWGSNKGWKIDLNGVGSAAKPPEKSQFMDAPAQAPTSNKDNASPPPAYSGDGDDLPF